MAANPYAVTTVPKLKRSDRRAIAFLSSKEDGGIDAKTTFDRLKEKRVRELRSRFDLWIDGGRCDKYFHGWPNSPRYSSCFVFKWRDKALCHRFYGFLFHPKPNSNARFQICILVSHALKTTWETDERDLDGSIALMGNPLVIAAIKKEFSDKKEERVLWTN
jgi:hypothetical protein